MSNRRSLVSRIPLAITLAVALVATAAPIVSQDAGAPTKESLGNAIPKMPYSPYAGGAVPNRVFWGDSHLHTSDFRWTPEPLAPAWIPMTPMYSHGAVRWSPPPRDPCVWRGRSTGSSLRITRTTWASSRISFAGKPKILSDPTGKEWYRQGPGGARDGGRPRDHRCILAWRVPRGDHVLARLPGL